MRTASCLVYPKCWSPALASGHPVRCFNSVCGPSTSGYAGRPYEKQGTVSSPSVIAHLSFYPPEQPGSFNRMVGALVEATPEMPQRILSFAESSEHAHVVALRRSQLKHWEQLRLRAPVGGIRSLDHRAYALLARRWLAKHAPEVVICYDQYKLGALLRPAVPNSHLVLAQHGHGYGLSPEQTSQIYDRSVYDTVWTLTHAAWNRAAAGLSNAPASFVLPNGIDTGRFRPAMPEEKLAARVQFDLPADAVIVLYLGRLVEKKGAHHLVNAWAEIQQHSPEAFCWVVGQGDKAYGQELERLAARHPRIRFQGAAMPEEVPTVLQAADLYAFPGDGEEGCPLALMEALASGLAAVASGSGAVRELFAEITTVIPRPVQAADLGAALIPLVTDSTLRAHCGKRAREQMVAHHDWERYVREFSAFARCCLQGRPSFGY